MALITQTFSAVLFDMDGTLIDSTPAVEAHWSRWALSHGISPADILSSSHGVRTIDVIGKWKPELATQEEVLSFEGGIPGEDGTGAIELPGARALVERIVQEGGRWAVVTSGTSVLAAAWVKILNLPTPPSFITADRVTLGKPNPEGYLLARKQLGVPPPQSPPLSTSTSPPPTTITHPVLVVEDAPAGIRAGKAAGCLVLGLLTSHTLEQVLAAGADYVVRDLGDVEFVRKEEGAEGGVVLRIRVTSVKTGEVVDGDGDWEGVEVDGGVMSALRPPPSPSAAPQPAAPRSRPQRHPPLSAMPAAPAMTPPASRTASPLPPAPEATASGNPCHTAPSAAVLEAHGIKRPSNNPPKTWLVETLGLDDKQWALLRTTFSSAIADTQATSLASDLGRIKYWEMTVGLAACKLWNYIAHFLHHDRESWDVSARPVAIGFDRTIF
ncbi:HAD-like domain-containing protein [Peziza echinospora]|nr:HAD-like domain-containing protein [Peziza echinospora]